MLFPDSPNNVLTEELDKCLSRIDVLEDERRIVEQQELLIIELDGLAQHVTYHANLAADRVQQIQKACAGAGLAVDPLFLVPEPDSSEP